MSKFGFYQETGTAYYRKSINPIIARKRKKKKQHGHPVGAESADGAAPRCTKALALNLLPPGDIGTAPDTRGTRTAAPPPPPTRGRGHLAPGLPAPARVLPEAHFGGTRQQRARTTSRGIRCVTLTHVPGLLGLAIGPWRPPFSVGVHRGSRLGPGVPTDSPPGFSPHGSEWAKTGKAACDPAPAGTPGYKAPAAHVLLLRGMASRRRFNV